MRSLSIPPEVLEALTARNAFRLRWSDDEVLGRFARLAPGPNREVAQSLLNALQVFPPDPVYFDILDIRAGMGGTGYKVEVATHTAVRVTVTAKYHEGRKTVTIQKFQIGPRAVGGLKAEA